MKSAIAAARPLADSDSRRCAACGAKHRPGRYSAKARQCLIDEAARLARVASKSIDLLTAGHSPSDLTLMAMLMSMSAFAKAVDEHLRVVAVGPGLARTGADGSARS